MRTILVLATVLSTFVTQAFAEQGDVLVRLRGIVVAPIDDSSAILPTFPDASVSVDAAIMPELDFTYFLSDNIGAELILATTPHDISGEGSLAALGEIADVMALPPTLTLQYHFAPNASVRPYIGAGVNWTIFYDDEAKQPLIDAVGPTSVHLDDSVGWAVQAGLDFDISERFFFNVDVKYIAIDTTATLNSGGLVNTVDVDINPIVAGAGIGMRF